MSNVNSKKRALPRDDDYNDNDDDEISSKSLKHRIDNEDSDNHGQVSVKRKRVEYDHHHQESSISDLPVQLLVLCFEFLSTYEILRLSTVSRQFLSVVKSRAMWTQAYMDMQVLDDESQIRKRRRHTRQQQGIRVHISHDEQQRLTDQFSSMIKECQFSKMHLSCEFRLDWTRIVSSVIPQHCGYRLSKLKLTALSVSVETLMAALRQCPNLVHLNFRHYVPIEDIRSSLVPFEERKRNIEPASLRKLKKLKMYVISDDDLPYHDDHENIVRTERQNMNILALFLARSCPNLKLLVLAGNPSVDWCSGDILEQFSAHTKGLKKLLLSGLPGIRDEHLGSLLQGSPNLADLSIDMCENITARSIASLSRHSMSLVTLRLVNPSPIATNIDHVETFHTLKDLKSLILVNRQQRRSDSTGDMRELKKLIRRLFIELVPERQLKRCSLINIGGLQDLLQSDEFHSKITTATEIELLKVYLDDDIVRRVVVDNTNPVIEKLFLCQEISQTPDNGNNAPDFILSDETLQVICEKAYACALTNMQLNMKRLNRLLRDKRSAVVDMTLSAVQDVNGDDEGGDVDEEERGEEEEEKADQSSHTGLQRLALCNMSSFTDKMFDDIATSAPQLQKLALINLEGISMRSLLSASQHCKELETLHIRDCPIFDETLGANSVTSLYPFANLKEFDMERFRIPLMKQLFALLLSMPNVESLNLELWDGQIVVISHTGIQIIMASDIGCLLQIQESIERQRTNDITRECLERGGFWMYQLFIDVISDLLGDDCAQYVRDGDQGGNVQRQMNFILNVDNVQDVTDLDVNDNGTEDVFTTGFTFKPELQVDHNRGLPLVIAHLFKFYLRALFRTAEKKKDELRRDEEGFDDDDDGFGTDSDDDDSIFG